MIEIKPLGQIEARVTMPGSKSYTQRAMIMAALAEGDSRLQSPLISEDTGYLAEALRLLGANLVDPRRRHAGPGHSGTDQESGRTNLSGIQRHSHAFADHCGLSGEGRISPYRCPPSSGKTDSAFAGSPENSGGEGRKQRANPDFLRSLSRPMACKAARLFLKTLIAVSISPLF